MLQKHAIEDNTQKEVTKVTNNTSFQKHTKPVKHVRELNRFTK